MLKCCGAPLAVFLVGRFTLTHNDRGNRLVQKEQQYHRAEATAAAGASRE